MEEVECFIINGSLAPSYHSLLAHFKRAITTWILGEFIFQTLEYMQSSTVFLMPSFNQAVWGVVETV